MVENNSNSVGDSDPSFSPAASGITSNGTEVTSQTGSITSPDNFPSRRQNRRSRDREAAAVEKAQQFEGSSTTPPDGSFRSPRVAAGSEVLLDNLEATISPEDEDDNVGMVGDALVGQETITVERTPEQFTGSENVNHTVATAAAMQAPPCYIAPNQQFRIMETNSFETSPDAGGDPMDSSPSSRPGAFSVQQRAIGARPGWAGGRNQATNNNNNRGRPISFRNMFQSRRQLETQTPPEMRAQDNSIPPEMRIAAPSRESSAYTFATEGHEATVAPLATCTVRNAPQTSNLESNAELAEGKQPGNHRKWYIIAAILLLVLVGVGIGVGLGVGGSKGNAGTSMVHDNPPATKKGETPTGATHSQAAAIYKPLVLNYSDEATFSNPSSPQSKALVWLSESAPVNTTTGKSPLSTHRILVRYGLAVLYYSTDGPTWSHQIGFLDKDTHECDWNVNLTARFELELDQHYIHQKGVLCDDRGGNEERRLQLLYLRK